MNQKLMKKSLITLAVLGAFAGAAQAQTSTSVVTLYGSFDAGWRNITNAAVDAQGNSQSRTTMGSTGTYNSNRLGFKGTEDLGGGNNAHFNLEIGFNSGTGQLDTAATRNQLFDRTASVGMGGSWGAIDLGRQYSVSFRTIGAYDPFNYKYTGIIPLAGAAKGTSFYPTTGATSTTNIFGGTRYNNDIQYSGNFGPMTVRAEYALGERVSGVSNGASEALGVAYAASGFSGGIAYTQAKPNIANTTTASAEKFGRDQQMTLGGAFTSGPMRLAVGYIDEKLELNALAANAGDLKVKWAWLGGSYAMSPAVEFTVAGYQTKFNAVNLEGKRTLYIGGMTYAFSKRTNFYADIDYTKETGAIPLGAIPGGKEKRNGYSAGINHTF
jgi:predicted porin